MKEYLVGAGVLALTCMAAGFALGGLFVLKAVWLVFGQEAYEKLINHLKKKEGKEP